MINIVFLKRFIFTFLNYVIHEGRSIQVEYMYCGVQKRMLDPLELYKVVSPSGLGTKFWSSVRAASVLNW